MTDKYIADVDRAVRGKDKGNPYGIVWIDLKREEIQVFMEAYICIFSVILYS